jgi:methyl-accepting chemotaxis protein
MAINRMDQVTQQNAAMVEQTTAAGRTLADEAQDLGRLVGQFKVAAADARHAA